MARSKRHHYIPIALQKNFSCNGRGLWWSRRNETGKFVDCKEVPFESMFLENDLYTVLEEGRPSDGLEKTFYGKIDGILADVSRELIDSDWTTTIPYISLGQKQLLRAIIIEMARRVPDFLSNADRVLDDSLMRARARALCEFPNLEREIENIIDTRFNSREIRRSILAESRARPPRSALDAIAGYSIHLASPPPKMTFILSSQIVSRVGNRGSGRLGDPRTELWLPVGPRIAIVATKIEKPWPMHFTMSRQFMRDYNVAAAKRSTSIASSSRTLLESILKSATR